jgi:hypothetical protein
MNDIKNPKFFTAGHALFTVSNNNGEHYTYKISRNDDRKPLFVGILTGPNNETDYVYAGIYSPETSSLRLTDKSKYTNDSVPVKVFNWAIKKVVSQQPLPLGYSIQHSGKCCRCGRTLTTSESINRGWGPECDKYMS